MKTAISIPDSLNQSIEEFLQASQMSRSKFFQQAARFYLDKVSADAITANLDQVYGGSETAGETEDDVAFRRAALRHFRDLSENDEW